MDSAWIVAIPIVGSIGFFLTICVIAVSVSNTRRERARYQAEVQTRMIDRFSSAPEFVTFLSSKEGREFMQTFETQPRLAARDRILKGIRTATVLSFLGFAFVVISFMEDRTLIIPGLVLLGLGLGYVASTVLMMRLSKEWGLLDDPNRGTTTAQPTDQ